MSTTPIDRLNMLGLQLPPAPAAHGSYSPVVVHNGLVYVSGQLSRGESAVITGPVDHATPDSVLVEAGRVCVLRALSALHYQLGGLGIVSHVLFLRGFVNSHPSFSEHSRVLDTVSDILHVVFGENGKHARSAVGVSSLPSGGLLEIELTVAINTERSPHNPD